MTGNNTEVFWLGSIASLFAGLGTGVGALAIFLKRQSSARTIDALVSGAAGMMLAASFFSLLQPGIEYGAAQFGNRGLAVLAVIAGVFVGATILFCIHRYAPHEHFRLGKEGPASHRLSRLWLFVIAITLHNFPEGMSVGVGFASNDIGNGISLAVGIGVQNIPEGMAIAVSLTAIGYSRTYAFWVACLTGLVEPMGGALGAAAIWLVAPLMPVIFGTAAGAMLFIVSDEIIPETHRGGNEDLATLSLLIGITLMMFLDVVVD